jgi:hypothetical protein
MNEGELILDGPTHEVFMQDELLRSVGVRPPDGVILLHLLRQEGISDIPENLVNEDEIIHFLSERLNGRI